MKVSVTEAKGQLTELVRRAEEGEEIILTRHGHPAARIVPVKVAANAATRQGCLRRCEMQAQPRPTSVPALPEAKISSMTTTGFQSDRS